CCNCSISVGAKTKRGFAIAALLAGAFRFYQRRRDYLDCGQARAATDQYSRIGDLLSDVAAKKSWQNPYSRLPDAELCDGRKLSCYGKPLHGGWHRART